MVAEAALEARQQRITHTELGGEGEEGWVSATTFPFLDLFPFPFPLGLCFCFCLFFFFRGVELVIIFLFLALVHFSFLYSFSCFLFLTVEEPSLEGFTKEAMFFSDSLFILCLAGGGYRNRARGEAWEGLERRFF